MTTPGQPMNRDQAFRLAIVVERRARVDADHWAARLQQQARLVAHGRAAQMIEPHKATPDPLRTALTREWYVRVFEDQIHTRLDAADPGTVVTATETEHVAECLRQGVAYRIHGPDGSIVLNPDGPSYLPGQNGLTHSSDAEPARPELPERWHRAQLESLVEAQAQRRSDDEKLVAATWNDLTPDQRTAFAAYLHQQQGTPGPASYPQADSLFPEPAVSQTYTAADTGKRNQLTGTPTQVAAETFGHQPRAGVAEVNAAHALAAKAFPPNAKPPTITATGQIRSTAHTPEKPHDTGRDR